MIWMSIRDYFDKHADADARKRCKNLSQKKSYLVNTLQISLQMDKGCNKKTHKTVTVRL